jgi:hypothetical protein
MATLAANGLASVGYDSGQGASANAYNNANFIDNIATIFWTSTSLSTLTTDANAWRFDTTYDYSAADSMPKTNMRRFLCVRTDN